VSIPGLDVPAIAELAARPQWVCWRYETRAGKPTKVPITPSGTPASVTNPRTWSSFADACEAVVRNETLEGVGYVLSPGDPYVGIDLDGCLDAKGVPNAIACEFIDSLGSYAEVTPSGRGLHVWIRASLPGGRGRRKGQIEVYAEARYLTVTGKQFGDAETIEERSPQLAELVKRHLGEEATQRAQGPGVLEGVRVDRDSEPPSAKLSAILANDRKFKRTWERNRPDLRDDPSSLDASLAYLAASADWSKQEIVNLLIAFNRDSGRIAKVLRTDSNGVYDYLQRTLEWSLRAVRCQDSERTMIEGLAEQQDEERYDAAAQESSDHLLQEVSADLGLPIKRVIQRGLETPRYYVVIGDAEVNLGGPSSLLNQNAFQAAILGTTRTIMKPLKTPKWLRIVQRMVRAAELEDVGEGESRHQTRQLLVDLLHREPPAEATDDKVLSGVTVSKDDATYIAVKSLLAIARNWWGENLSVRQLCERLREVGCEPQALPAKTPEGKVTTRSYWRVPNGLV
jgi:hypothetical protein